MLRVVEAVHVHAKVDAAINPFVGFAQFDLLKAVIQRIDKLAADSVRRSDRGYCSPMGFPSPSDLNCTGLFASNDRMRIPLFSLPIATHL